MKAWVATGAALLVAGAVVAALLVDPHLWRSERSSATHTRVRVVPREHPQVAKQASSARPKSPYALRTAPRHMPVNVRFAASNQPRAGILFNVHTGRVLWEHDPGRRLPIASLTKMMTALIIARRHKPSERALITHQALAYEGSGMGVLPKGKRVSVRDLFYGLLLVSGNDAAIALAQHDSRTVGAFVRRMNRWRSRLGLRCTHFSTPSGILD
jgi:D-alanyl-D-alanine carboxypeptidase (penicillin-binding protein 5/6)